MLITRWQAPLLPKAEQMNLILESEGLDPQHEVFKALDKIPEHRHPFGEVRLVISGELMVQVSGTQILLRAGDRLEIPASTRHSYQTHGSEDCHSFCAYRIA